MFFDLFEKLLKRSSSETLQAQTLHGAMPNATTQSELLKKRQSVKALTRSEGPNNSATQKAETLRH